ncbi:MAG: glycoside hydrolase family 10 protein [Actinomycetota bacterium]
MRKTTAALASALLIAALPAAAVAAPSDEEEPLYTWVKNDDGSYGYSTTPVQTYPASGEQVTIPTELAPENRSFASTWVATISNLNFGQPSSEADFVDRFDTVLDDFEEWNLNALIFQVRPLLDAYYPSENNPWSQFVSGAQGTDPGYDPLEYMVEATHERGMEYHAWLNPYRVTNTKMTAPATLTALDMTADEVTALSIPEYIAALNDAGILADENFAVQNPDEVLEFEEKLFLDPGEPEVREHVADTVSEIVENYDVDAIHFDDYFYPYRITVDGVNVYFGDEDEDRETFEEHGFTEGYADTEAGIEEWRRDNITALIADVGERIDERNDAAGTAVQFGVSPFGIWEHIDLDPNGSHTPVTSSQTYSETVFADTRGWVQDELIDYISPQIYWSFDQGAAPYGELAQWWSDTAADSRTQVYVGHPLYKHVNNGSWEQAWMNPEEVPHQIRFNQKIGGLDGSILFSYNDIRPSDVAALPTDQQPRHEAKNEAIELLKNEAFAEPKLVPAKPWLSSGAVAAPQDATVEDGTLSWSTGDADGTRQYAIYAGTGTPADIVATGGTLVDTVWAGGESELSFEVPTGTAADTTWVVTALDAAAVESAPVAAAAPVDPTTPPTDPTDPDEPTDPTDPDDGGSDGGSGGGVADGGNEDGTADGDSDLATTGGDTPVTALLVGAALLVTGAAAAGIAAYRRRHLA